MKRLILFDIDGTLLLAGAAAKRAFHRAMIEVYGTAGPIGTHSFAGKTDPQIARELLTLHGLDDAATDAGLPELWRVYLRELEVELARPDHATTVLPGVTALLAALDEAVDDAVVGLLTGNIEPGAHLKLRSASLREFRFGAYGSDAERRDALPRVAVERAAALTGRSFEGSEICIIGDTPADVTCGRSLGVRAIGVATGSYDAGTLTDAGADTVFRDLSDTSAVLEALLS